MNLEFLVEKIAWEVVNRINEAEDGAKCKKDDSKGMEKVLFIVPRQTVNLANCLQMALGMFCGYNILLLTSGCVPVAEKHDGKILIGKLDDEKTRESVIEDFNSISSVCLISPGISLLEDIINYKDTGFIEYIMMNSLIYGKTAKVVTDIEYNKPPVNKLFKKIKNVLDQISAMGIDIEFAGSKKDTYCDKNDTSRGLITEKDVVVMAKIGKREILCQKGTIITPLAADKAKESDINILFKED